jgi:hypothetical protein
MSLPEEYLHINITSDSNTEEDENVTEVKPPN